MKEKFAIRIFFICIFIFIFYIFYVLVGRFQSEFKNYERKKLIINKTVFTVYISDTDTKRTKGLSGVKKLHEREGMLFLWDYPDYRYFWMKDMNFSLDFVFIRNHVVVDILENVSPQSYPGSFTSQRKSDSVIEFPAGTVKKYGIQTNSKISTILPK